MCSATREAIDRRQRRRRSIRQRVRYCAPSNTDRVFATLINREALAAFAGSHLAGFKKPRRIEFVASLPRNAYNKVQTHVLKQEFGAA